MAVQFSEVVDEYDLLSISNPVNGKVEMVVSRISVLCAFVLKLGDEALYNIRIGNGLPHKPRCKVSKAARLTTDGIEPLIRSRPCAAPNNPNVRMGTGNIAIGTSLTAQCHRCPAVDAVCTAHANASHGRNQMSAGCSPTISHPSMRTAQPRTTSSVAEKGAVVYV